jgi:hypothetical protein
VYHPAPAGARRFEPSRLPLIFALRPSLNILLPLWKQDQPAKLPNVPGGIPCFCGAERTEIE